VITPPKNLLEVNACGLYCAAGDFYIDPWKPVNYAVLTHAHSDHARSGSGNYLAHTMSAKILTHRLGAINLQTVRYGEPVIRKGVRITLHPAGHIPGSAQVRVEQNGEIWVVSGDYKLGTDGISEPFEPQKCHVFISESTFGLPVYKWESQVDVFESIQNWWSANSSLGRASVIAGYSLGKAQRILKNLNPEAGRIYCHGSVAASNEALEASGLSLPPWERIDPGAKKDIYAGAMIVCPPSALGSTWMKRFGSYSTGYCSGWMSVRGARRRRAVDRGFVLSDHADWDSLLIAVKETTASRVLITHGYSAAFSRYLREKGYDSQELQTLYGEEEE